MIVNQNARSDAKSATSMKKNESALETIESDPAAAAEEILPEPVIKAAAKQTGNDVTRNNQFPPFCKIVNLSPL